MMKTEYTECDGFLQRDGVEHKEYAEAYSTEIKKQKKETVQTCLKRCLTEISEQSLQASKSQ